MNTTQPEYSYPVAYFRTKEASFRSEIKTLIVGLLLIGVSIGWGIYGDPAPYILALMSAVGLFLGVGAVATLRTPLPVGVLTLFGKPIKGANTFGRGEALARNAGAVDDLTHLLGNIPLSAFGYDADALPLDADIWYSPEEVLPTVHSLVKAFHENHLLLGAEETPAVLADLESLQIGLEKATAEQVPFRFLLRYSKAVCHCHPLFDYGYI